MQSRKTDLAAFYELLEELRLQNGGYRLLSSSTRSTGWPKRGVYFFMEEGETRSDTGSGLRVVRVGTHGLTAGSKSTLWQRLSQHKGSSASWGGNHRGSIFRLLVGTTLLQDGPQVATWGDTKAYSPAVRAQEAAIERQVSALVRAMPVLFLAVDDDPSEDSLRSHVERNSIALLSNYLKAPLDPPSPSWRGLRCDREKVRLSGLWNQRHVDERYDPAFLATFKALIKGSGQS